MQTVLYRDGGCVEAEDCRRAPVLGWACRRRPVAVAIVHSNEVADFGEDAVVVQEIEVGVLEIQRPAPDGRMLQQRMRQHDGKATTRFTNKQKRNVINGMQCVATPFEIHIVTLQ